MIPEFKGNGFPSHLFSPETSVLSLFSAAFGGENDIQHIHDAGVQYCTMMDNDFNKLLLLSEKYNDYFYEHNDVFNYLCMEKYSGMITHYDIVVCDQWSADDNKINDSYFENLKSIANKFVVLSIGQKYLNILDHIPDGDYYHRSMHNGGTYWRVVNAG